MANSHGPQLPALLGITARQLRFAELVGLGYSPGAAAELVGISVEGADALCALPAVQAYARHMARGQVSVACLPLSVRTVKDILKDPNAPASARVAAVRLVWTSVGMFSPQPVVEGAPPTASGAPPISPQADAELAALRDRLELLRRYLTTPPLEGESEPVADVPADPPNPLD